jgi:hypothetical protein
MKNPYHILGLKQNAERKEIIKAKRMAMRKREYPLKEIIEAEIALLNPARRLAADFMHPSRIRSVRLKPITIELKHRNNDTNSLNENAFDSLK